MGKILNIWAFLNFCLFIYLFIFIFWCYHSDKPPILLFWYNDLVASFGSGRDFDWRIFCPVKSIFVISSLLRPFQHLLWYLPPTKFNCLSSVSDRMAVPNVIYVDFSYSFDDRLTRLTSSRSMSLIEGWVKGCLPQILISPFLNTLSHLVFY